MHDQRIISRPSFNLEYLRDGIGLCCYCAEAVDCFGGECNGLEVEEEVLRGCLEGGERFGGGDYGRAGFDAGEGGGV